MIIRDFLYLDVDVVRSFAAQVFEGVTESIVDEVREAHTQAHSPRDARTKDNLPVELATASLRNESRVLHDHMFSLLEKRLSTAVVSLDDVEESQIPEKLRGAFLVRITGEADIEDYDRLHSFLANFDKLAQAMALIQMATPEHQIQIVLAQAELASAKGAEQNDARKRLKELTDVNVIAKNISGAGSNNLSGIKDVIGEFRSGVFEIVVPSAGSTYAFRSVLDTNWLRVSPERLRALYGGHSGFGVTILGQVTNLPQQKQIKSSPEPVAPEVDANSVENATNETRTESEGEVEPQTKVAGHIRNLVNIISMMERAFLQSAGTTDVIIRPIAIYRETKIAD